MKKLLCLMLLGTSLLFTGCHEHTWTDATCTQPMTCQECGKTEGEMLEHTWLDATCTKPKTCKRCKKTDGEAIGHTWLEATCTTPKTCENCKKTEGSAKKHIWIDATCTSPSTCNICGEIRGEAKGHTFQKATFEKPKTCIKCGHTEGTALEKLSNHCDAVLASGTDKDGNLFELVANQNEDHSGVTIEIGIIKNNEWSIDLTTKSPFIGTDGFLTKRNKYNTGSIYDENSLGFDYIGAGCFHYNGSIWNGNNGKYYMPIENNKFHPVISAGSGHGLCTYINNDGEFLLHKDGTFQVLTSHNMTIKTLKSLPYVYTNEIFPLSEGLFALYDYPNVGIGFFNTNGEKIIDLSDYKFYRIVKPDGFGNVTIEQNLVFKDGKCTFTVLNEIGTEYKITIDKQGNVLSSTKAE